MNPCGDLSEQSFGMKYLVRPIVTDWIVSIGNFVSFQEFVIGINDFLIIASRVNGILKLWQLMKMLSLLVSHLPLITCFCHF